jgi:hypothetical protein
MADVRIQVATYLPDQLARDHIVNTVYFRDINAVADTDYMNLAVGVRDVFRARRNHPDFYVIEARAYNMDDAKPRPVKALAPPLRVISTGAGAAAPREVALCLSYFSGRNLPSQRGRIYIGPFAQADMETRPNSFRIEDLRTLATGLAGVGGADVDWSLHSPKRGGLQTITNVWVDNEWDTIRSRGLRATARSAGTTGE